MTAEEIQAKRRKEEALLLLLLLGSSLGWTLADIRRIATVGPQQIQQARQLWQQLAPGNAALINGQGWQPNQQTFGTLTPAQLKQATIDFLAAVSDQLQQLTAPLVAGDLTIEEWQRQMGRYVRAAYVAVAAIAVGGLSRLLPADVAAVTQLLRFSLTRLEKFAKQAEHQDASAGTADVILNRVTLYGASGNGLFEKVRRLSHQRAVDDETGKRLFLMERNVLGVAEHCTEGERPGCVQESRRGWVDIGTLSIPGSRECLVNCKCKLEFKFE